MANTKQKTSRTVGKKFHEQHKGERAKKGGGGNRKPGSYKTRG